MQLPSTSRCSIAALSFTAISLLACQGPAQVERATVVENARAGGKSLGDSLYPALGNDGYDLQHVDLELDIVPKDGTLHGVARLQILAKIPLSAMSLDLTGLAVETVRQDGEPLIFIHEEAKLDITLQAAVSAGTRFELEIHYGGTPSSVPSPSVPFIPGVGWMRAGQDIYVLSQPNGASSVIPINDHPLDKATYDVRLTVPQPLTAISVGRLVGVEDTEQGREFHFRSDAPVASSLFTFAVGHFERIEAIGQPVSMTYYFPPNATREQRDMQLRGGDILEFLTSKLGPYPFDSCGALLSTMPMGAALETHSLPTYGAEVSDVGIIAHELAHQWLGNSVTIERWRDLWLAEGLAEYMTWVWHESEMDDDGFRQLLGQGYAYMHAQKLPPPGAPKIDELFGSGMYVRGAWSAHALRMRMGDADFFELMKRWTQTHRHSNASLADFMNLASEIEGEDVSDTLNAWLFAPTPPLVSGFEWALPRPEATE